MTPSAAVRIAEEHRASTASPTASSSPGTLRRTNPATSCPSSGGMGGNRATTLPAKAATKSRTYTAKTAPPGSMDGPMASHDAHHHATTPPS